MEYLTEVVVARSDVIGLGLLIILFIAFTMERRPPVVIAVFGAMLMLALNYLSPERLLEVFSNKAPLTIAAMFAITGSLIRTGVLEAIAGFALNRLQERPKLAIAELVTGSMVASGFVNNTPVVMVMIPIVKRLARSIGVNATRLLLPLSYISILGGTLTLIGTSTNLLVNGVAEKQGQEPFGFFEITEVGLIAAAAGLVFLLLFGKLLLPNRPDDEEDVEDSRYFSELSVNADSPYIDLRVEEVEFLKRPGVKLLGVRKGKKIVRKDLDSHLVQSSERLLVLATSSELASLNNDDEVDVGLTVVSGGDAEGEDLDDPEAVKLVEAAISSSNSAIGRRVAEISLLSKHPVRILGISRPGHIAGPDLPSARVRVGDRLLVVADQATAREMNRTADLVDVATSRVRPYQRGKAPIAILTLASVVLGAALFDLPIEALSLAGVAIVLMFRCVEPEEAWASIDGDTLVLIFAMLAFGAGLDSAGTVDLIVSNVTPLLQNAPPTLILFAVYLITAVLTAMVTNNAVAVIMAPLVIQMADELAIDPRQLVVAVMFAASASFATPIGYQTNTLVYSAGNYRFADFMRVGIPMTIVVGIATCVAIPVFF